MLAATLLTLALSTGTVKLQVVDEVGNPIPNQTIWLAETNSTKPIRPFGDLWYIPDTRLKGQTDRLGRVSIGGVPKGKPMMVVTRFGPRFVTSGPDEEPDRDVMKFEGAVYPGRTARVVIARNYEISGRATDYKGAPLAGVPISLQDTSFGHMSGYPLAELDVTKTDAAGNYRFTRLPNCTFTVTAQPAPPAGVETHGPNRRWTLVSMNGDGLAGVARQLDRPKSSCDFRVSRPAEISVLIKKESGVELKGWTLSLGDSYSGWLPGYRGWTQPEGASNTWHVLPGTYRLEFTRDSNNRSVSVGVVRVGEGDHRTVEVRMSEILRRERKR